MTIRVLLADDQALLRATFTMLIDSCDDLTVVAEASDGAEAIRATRTHHPDVVLMDIRMPGTDGLTATETICAETELAGTRILILTTFENDEYVARALRAGASGFIGKHATATELLDAIRTVARGETLLSPAATKSLVTQFLANPIESPAAGERTVDPGIGDLTNRELEITKLAAEGRSNDDIAGELVISVLTVRTHIQRAMSKLGARDRAQLVVIAYRNGLVPLDPPR